LFVARFIGSPGMNLLKGHYADGALHLPGENHYPAPAAWQKALREGLRGEEVIVGFRPEAAHISPHGALQSQVYADALHGAFTMLHLSLDGERGEAMAHVRTERNTGLGIGAPVRFDLDPERVRFFDPTTEKALACA
jgi:multiple sugar transport system ATP-binding protein